MSTGTGGPPTAALPSRRRPAPWNARNLGSCAASSSCAKDEGPAAAAACSWCCIATHVLQCICREPCQKAPGCSVPDARSAKCRHVSALHGVWNSLQCVDDTHAVQSEGTLYGWGTHLQHLLEGQVQPPEPSPLSAAPHSPGAAQNLPHSQFRSPIWHPAKATHFSHNIPGSTLIRLRRGLSPQ